MKTYVVGGAVRDRLLGLPVVDRDHVVVGATVDEMIAAGYKPVGRDFPVFLHPITHEEYALARTEKKVAPGYAGFVFHADPAVTLEADLERRDLTVNAIAEDETDGRLVDPFGGRTDLEQRVLRHVGPAFVEDPVRLLRVARFAARFVDFTIAPETLALMRRMTAAGEVDALVPERVWQEVARGLMERRPSRLVDVLADTGALERVMPEVAGTLSVEGNRDRLVALDRAATDGRSLDVRFAVLTAPTPSRPSALPRTDAPTTAIETLCKRLAVPRATRDLAVVVAREGDTLRAAAAETSPDAWASVVTGAMERGDAFRRKGRFTDAIAAIASAIADPDSAAAFGTRLQRALDAAGTIDAGAIARQAGGEPSVIAERLRSARRAAVAASRV